MTLNELRVAAKRADKAVKARNVWCDSNYKRIWDDPEYLRLLDIADELDRKVAEKEKEEKNVG
jgi:hypothetical protein